jgi:hypothetical protein
MMLSAKRGHWEEKYLKYKGKYLALSRQINYTGGSSNMTLTKFQAKSILPYISETHTILGPGSRNLIVDPGTIKFVDNVVDLYTSLPKLGKDIITREDTRINVQYKNDQSITPTQLAERGCEINQVFCGSTPPGICKTLTLEEYNNSLKYFSKNYPVGSPPIDIDRYNEIRRALMTCKYICPKDLGYIQAIKNAAGDATIIDQINDQTITEKFAKYATTTFSQMEVGGEECVMAFLDNLGTSVEIVKEVDPKDNMSKPTTIRAVNPKDDKNEFQNRCGYYDVKTLNAFLINKLVIPFIGKIRNTKFSFDKQSLKDFNNKLANNGRYTTDSIEFNRTITSDGTPYTLTGLIDYECITPKITREIIALIDEMPALADAEIITYIDEQIQQLPYFYNFSNIVKKLLYKMYYEKRIQDIRKALEDDKDKQIKPMKDDLDIDGAQKAMDQIIAGYNAILPIIERQASNYTATMNQQLTKTEGENAYFAWKVIFIKLYRKIRLLIKDTQPIKVDDVYYKENPTKSTPTQIGYDYIKIIEEPLLLAGAIYKTLTYKVCDENGKPIRGVAETVINEDDFKNSEWIRGKLINNKILPLTGGGQKKNNNIRRSEEVILHGGAYNIAESQRANLARQEEEREKARAAKQQGRKALSPEQRQAEKDKLLETPADDTTIQNNITVPLDRARALITTYNQNLHSTPEQSGIATPAPARTITFTTAENIANELATAYPNYFSGHLTSIVENLAIVNAMTSQIDNDKQSIQSAIDYITNYSQPSSISTKQSFIDKADIEKNEKVITDKQGPLNQLIDKKAKAEDEINKKVEEIKNEEPTRTEVFALNQSIPATLTAIQDVLTQSDKIKTQLVEAMDTQSSLITTDITNLSNKIRDGNTENIIKATTNVKIDKIKEIQEVKDFMSAVNNLTNSEFVKQVQKIITDVKTYITRQLTPYLDKNKIDPNAIITKLTDITPNKNTTQLSQIKTEITTLLEDLNKKMNNRNNAFSQLCISIPSALADINDATVIIGNTLTDAQTKCKLDNSGGATIQEYLGKVAAATQGFADLSGKIAGVEAAIRTAEATALALLTPGGSEGSTGLASLGRLTVGVGSEDAAASAERIRKMQNQGCIKELIRIRPALKGIDESATELQLLVKGQIYDPGFLRAFQNNTRMITNFFCIDFTQVFDPPTVGKSVTIFNKTGANLGNELPNYILKDTDVYFESGKKEVSEPKNSSKNVATEVTKINDIFTAIGTGITPQTKDGVKLLKAKVNGKIFDDLASFQEKALAQPGNTDTYLDVVRGKSKDNWEYTALNEIQQNFSSTINPLTLDPIFNTSADSIKKNVLLVFYGASGSGKTFSFDAILIDLFKKITEAFRVNSTHQGFKIKIVSDYLNNFFDYNSDKANTRYNDTSRLSCANPTKTKPAKYNFTGSFADLMNKVNGTKNDLSIMASSDPTRGAIDSDKSASAIFKQIIIEDCTYRAGNGLTKSICVDKVTDDGSGGAPYFCEGLKTQAVSTPTNILEDGEYKFLTITKDNVNDMFKQVVNRIKLFRGVNDTGLNAESSRSHLIILLDDLNKSTRDNGKFFCMIDFAGTEDLNYLLPLTTQNKLNSGNMKTILESPNTFGEKYNGGPLISGRWETIPNSQLFRDFRKNTTSYTEYLDVLTEEYKKMKRLALKTKKKYDYILDNPTKELSEVNEWVKTTWTDAEIDKELTKQLFPIKDGKNIKDDVILAEYLKMMHLESIHINGSLGDFRGILQSMKTQKEASPTAIINVPYAGNKLIIKNVVAPLINSGGPTNIILVGAINPRRSDDFNSYNTMTQIAAKMVASCDNTAAPCN